jgi:hypothetical protein
LVKKLLRERNAMWPEGMSGMAPFESTGVSSSPEVSATNASDREATEYDEL